VLTDLNVSPENAVAVTCGPPIMIRFTIQALEKLGFKDEQIVTTLERRMKCGVGLCGRCNIGEKFVVRGRPGVHPGAAQGAAAGILGIPAPLFSAPAAGCIDIRPEKRTQES